jgi:osmoprotectant transport system substrate-binding protein
MRFIKGMIRRPAQWAGLLVLGFALAACGTGEGDGSRLVVGSTNFSEQEIVANMYRFVLEDAGYDVEARFQLGQREIVFPALENGEVDLYPEYVGTMLEFVTGGAGAATTDTEETTSLLREALSDRGVEVLEPSPAQDKNGLVVTPETAGQHGLTAVSDLEPVAGELVFGGPPECPQRPLCLQGYEQVYGLSFADFRSLDPGGPLTVAALENGDIDVALMFTTQGIIFDKGWVLLEEDRDLQPAENIAPAIRSEVLTDDIAEPLNRVSAALTTEELTELNKRVDVDGEDPDVVAREWLESHGLLS